LPNTWLRRTKVDKEEQKKEELGLKDTVSGEVKEGGVQKKNLAAVEKRDKALALAHDKYVATVEAARKEYVREKERINREFEEATR
jgi:hypothetical protein